MSGGTWAQEKAHFGLHPAQFIDDVANVMLDCASLFLSRSLEMNTGASRCCAVQICALDWTRWTRSWRSWKRRITSCTKTWFSRCATLVRSG